MSGVVVEVRVKEGAEIKKGDPVCGKYRWPVVLGGLLTLVLSVMSAMKARCFRRLTPRERCANTLFVDGVCRHRACVRPCEAHPHSRRYVSSPHGR